MASRLIFIQNIILVIMTLMLASACAMSDQEKLLQSARESLNSWSKEKNWPTQNENLSIYKQDDTFAIVVAKFDTRANMDSGWQRRTAWMSCYKLANSYECESSMDKQSYAEYIHSSATNYEVLESKWTSIACRGYQVGKVFKSPLTFTAEGLLWGEELYLRQGDNHYVRQFKTYPNYDNESRIELGEDGSLDYVQVGELYRGDNNMYLCNRFHAIMR